MQWIKCVHCSSFCIKRAHCYSVYNDLENGAIYDDDVYNQLRTYVQNLQPSPQTMTNIAQALNYVAMMVFHNHGDRRSGTDHIIIISDGEVSSTSTQFNPASPNNARFNLFLLI